MEQNKSGRKAALLPQKNRLHLLTIWVKIRKNADRRGEYADDSG